MTTDISVSDQTYQYFLQEAAELLETIDDELQNIGEEFSVQKVHNLMRAAHTLKGASASVGLDAIKKTTHSLEDVFKALCYQDTVISSEMEGLIFQGHDCLKLLMSAQLAGAQVDEADILDRMAAVVTRLQNMLGDRFGQGGHLPTSSELGFDMTQSIFEVGVAQRIQTLEEALEEPDADELSELLETQAEVFLGLSESLNLPGFGDIATATLRALEKSPDRVLEIAPVALANYQAAKSAVLAGDREQGGKPSAALQQFYGQVKSDAKSRSRSSTGRQSANRQSTSSQTVSKAKNKTPQSNPNLFHRVWAALTQTVRRTLFDQASSATAPTPKASKQTSSPVPSQVSTTAAKNTAALPALSIEEAVKDDIAALPNFSIEDLSIEHAIKDDKVETGDYKLGDNELENIAELAKSIDVVDSVEDEHEQLSSARSSEEPPRSAAAETTTASRTTGSQTQNATIRTTIKDLDQLNQSMGELLTHHNRQALYNDQLTTLIKTLFDRISGQQDRLNQPVNQFQNQPLGESLGQHPNQSLGQPTAQFLSQSLSQSLAQDNSQSLDSYAAQFDSLELDQYSDIQLLSQSFLEETLQQSELVEAIELFVSRSGQELAKQKRLLAGAREVLIGTRMLPLGKIFQRFPLALERLKGQYKKQVDLSIVGSNVLVDKVIADKLYDPLLHLFRNAFDHGIEPAEHRVQNNKPATGNITIEALQEGRHLVINVRDDGQGLNLEKIRQKAIDTQIITAEAAATLTPEQTTDLLFEAGFSTASEVDDLSGRGVGLDAVQAQVRSLQGWITIDNEPGSGSCFSLHIPSSLTIAKLLLCQAKEQIYALIVDAVEHILVPSAKQMRVRKGGKTLIWQIGKEEQLIPIYPLADVLHYKTPMSRHRLLESNIETRETGKTIKDMSAAPIILLRHKDTLVGLEVGQLLGEQELVITALEKTILPPDYVYGSSILPDGQPTLVLDGVTLAKAVIDRYFVNGSEADANIGAKRKFENKDKEGISNHSDKKSARAKSAKNELTLPGKLILTVDDSITVRNTLTEALQKSQYRVIQARDGAEALQQLNRHPNVAAILCDIEMPGMNGFEFLKARQQQPAIAAIPTIMLTSRKGAKHQQLTEALGATAYLTKPYLAPQLLQTVAEVIKTHVFKDQVSKDPISPRNSPSTAVGESS
ncbi:response regulator [cf. Phormidesmis sp. LEGE 11477]|uniref:hybrid sensor histidine kinase/response regulator n=1 Tax=cf. Phormidesmis sp. LEGE 11477 TaxID=1828680 RepID=UPI0018819F11|nr:response regulator [cf. Phormidesmis sp. LEGE 11477]MBE9060973.1 response regulator [cf. Phormidesmis sp. LEGE 11477]